MAVPNTTQTTYIGGGVQKAQGIGAYTQVTPSLSFLFLLNTTFIFKLCCEIAGNSFVSVRKMKKKKKKRRHRGGYLCSPPVPWVACTLPSIESSLCGFWHSHPNIPLNIWKMYLFVCMWQD